MIAWRVRHRTIEVPCIIDIEHTSESLHAHVVLDGVQVGPGDAVKVHDAPAGIGFGERIRCDRRATIVRAGPLQSLWTRLRSRFEITELYEVGFSIRRKQ